MRPLRWLGAALVLTALAAALIMPAHGSTLTFAVAVPVGLGPDAVTVDTHSGHTFVANYADNTVTMLATRSDTVLRTIPVGRGPVAVAVDEADHRSFVLNQLDGSVSVLDTATGALLRTVSLAQGGLVDLAVDEGTRHVFVVGGVGTTSVTGTVYTLDARTGAVIGASGVGAAPRSVAIDARTRRAFIPNTSDGTVSVLETVGGRVIATSPVGAGPTAVAVDAWTQRAFVANSAANTVTVLDARTGVALGAVAVGSWPQTLAVATWTSRVFVVNGVGGTVSVLDARTGTRLRTVAVGAPRPRAVGETSPVDVLVDERGGRVFVLNGSDLDRNYQPTNGSVSVLDTQSGRELARPFVGRSPVALAVSAPTSQLWVVNADGGRPPVTGLTADRVWTSVWGWLPHGLRQALPWRPRPLAPSATQDGSLTVLDIAGV